MSRITVVLVASALLSGCAASERQRVVSMGPVDTGAGSLEATRRQIAGTWTLTRLEVADAAGTLTPVRAKAQLRYDDFGNLSIKGVLEEPLPGQKTITDHPALMYEGRAVIDAAKQELVFMGLNASVKPDPSLVEKVALENRRKFTVSDKQLTLDTVDAQGRVVMRTTYTK